VVTKKGKKMKKIIHLADTHIRLLKYHEEYKIIFEKIYDKIREEDPDFIVHCGDIIHNKISLCPEIIPMVSDFLRNLANIAPLYILPGNHDGNLKNLQRMDSLTPIIKEMNHPNIFYSRESKEYIVDNFKLFAWSPFDKENWSVPSENDDYINICLYHGSVTGVETDIGYVFEEGEREEKDFQLFDYAFLGDIHKSNQIVGKDGRKRYSGSTIQQNFGETNDKGFLVWRIKDKRISMVKHVIVPHHKPFITIPIDENGELPKNMDIPVGSRVRLMPRANLSYDKIQYLTSLIQNNYRPEYVKFVNKHKNKTKNVDIKSSRYENIREITVQEKILKDFLKNFNISEEVKEKIFILNEQYNQEALRKDEALRDIYFEILEMEWNNLYNYGTDNKLSLENLKGVVGIFGKNYSGKSSILDSLLLGMFNSDSKQARKNIHYVNENKSLGDVKVKIKIGDNVLNIERKIEKYLKNIKKEDSLEARVEVDFTIENTKTGEVYNKTQEKRNITDEEIQKFIGTREDFLLSSMAAQNKSHVFIEQGPTDRKKTIARFLDLEFFDKKFECAKSNLKELKGYLKEDENVNFYEKKVEFEDEIAKNNENIREQKERCDELRKSLESIKSELQAKKSKIDTNIEYIDINIVDQDKQKQEQLLKSNMKSQEELKNEISDDKNMIEEYAKLLDSIDIGDIERKQKINRKKFVEITQIRNKIEQEEVKYKLKKKSAELLSEVPCGTQYPQCKFIKNAFDAKEEINLLENNLRLLKEQEKNLSNVDFVEEQQKTDEYFKIFQESLKKKQQLSSGVEKKRLVLERKGIERTKIEENIEKLLKKESEYWKYKVTLENNKKLSNEIKDLEGELRKKYDILSYCEAKHLELHSNKGKLEEQLSAMKEKENKYKNKLIEYSANELLTKAYHPNGIPFSIIKDKLSQINEEIRKCLHNIVDFDIFLEAENKKLEIFIQHPKYNPRPIEGCSGAEKSLASMALRLALLNVSSLPKSNIFILDEPGTALDIENLDGFIQMLEMIKENFQTVFLISHMEILKDVVDSVIEINNVRGFAKVNS